MLPQVLDNNDFTVSTAYEKRLSTGICINAVCAIQ